MFSYLDPPDRNGCRFSCNHCFCLTPDQPEMVEHVTTMHKPKERLVCPYCRGVYGTKRSLSQHISLRHRELHAKSKMQQRSQFFPPQ
jgi:hypothetical protein